MDRSGEDGGTLTPGAPITFVLAIDQGTTGTRAAVYDQTGRLVSKSYREFSQIYPHPGWVEHNPLEIWRTVETTVNEVLRGKKRTIAAVGITNQRETTVVWNRKTGRPVHNAIVWQCRRTAPDCARLKKYAPLFKRKTGLPLDPYFSGTKIAWILKNVNITDRKNILFGTIDSWLIWKLTGGRVHATDFTNASRTLLLNIHTRRWDPELCRILRIPGAMLPGLKNSADDYGAVSALRPLNGVPIAGVAGDQQAALFGQGCFAPGEVKNTYGTGCFAMMNTGKKAIVSRKGLLTTLAADGRGKPAYALEGAVFIAGAAVQWLRDELKILTKAAESEAAARALKDNGGVYLVPAFVGLGAPHWNPEARGTLTGLTRGSGRRHLIRAALEAMAYQSNDVLSLMASESRLPIRTLAVDGGAAANNFLMQFQADISHKAVERPRVIESTALGAAFLAGLQAGVWKDAGKIASLRKVEKRFIPRMDAKTRERNLGGWRRALRQALTV